MAEQSWSAVVDKQLLMVTSDPPSDDFQSTLQSAGCRIEVEPRLEAGLDRLEDEPFDVVVLDADDIPAQPQLPRPIEETASAWLLRVDAPVPATYRRTLDLGMDTFVRRDIGPEALLRLVEQELRVDDENETPEDQRIDAGPIIGHSDEMRRLTRLIAGAAPSTASALITGESGVGKELVARAIHRLSPRRNQPFVAVNCGAIPENLIESELFGHEKGAFTGATSSRAGRFEQADRGTLLLDEIGELPRPMQVKLLRVLEEQTFERVGGSESISVDVRVLSATNRDLTVDIERDQFRRDLFFRLNVLEITVPPLREHRQDIDPLWEHFVHRAAAQEARRPPDTSTTVRRKLHRYDWSGNVRELRNVARHAVALSADDELTIEHLPQRFRSELEQQIQSRPGGIQVPGMTLEEVERASIIHTHEWTSDATETAEMLDISERKVYYKLKEYRQEGYLDEDGHPETPSQPDRHGQADSNQPRLIIAEDDRQLQWTLNEMLADDFQIVTVSTGRQLVDEVKRQRPDVILSDVRMPGLDGIQVLRESHAKEWNIPVILLSAYSNEANRAQAESLGASAFLEKPIDRNLLKDKLREALEEASSD